MSLRQLFPFFANNSVVYLDSAATTQKPQSVIDTITDFYQTQNATVHRSSHRHANQTTERYELARALVADWLGAPSANNIVWAKGTTDAINIVAQAWGSFNVTKGDHILVLESEHHANFVPWQQLCLTKQANFDVVQIDEQGHVNLDHYMTLLRNKPKLVALQHCSNALGNIHNLAQLITLAKEAGSTVLVDGAQAVAHIDINVEQLNCDFYAFSGHKVFAPTGIGALYVANSVKDQMKPVTFGGEMISDVSIATTQFRPFPHFLETGTPNISGVLGLQEAIKLVQSDAYQLAKQEIHALYRYLCDKLSQIPKVTLLGDTQHNIGIVSFIVEGEANGDIAALLSEQDIAIRAGHHCAMPLFKALGLSGSLRASINVYNDKNDIDRFISALEYSIMMLEE